MQANNLSAAFAVDISENLKADFALLRETPFYASGHQRQQKFSDTSVDKFARYIVCRNYAGLCFELSHLCWAIINTGSHTSVFEYFYIHEAVTATSMRNYFEKLGNDACSMNHASVTMQSKQQTSTEKQPSASLVIRIYQHSFIIHPSRANLLGIFMEWLVTILENVFDRLFEELSGKGFNAIQNVALMLQKVIYDYLSEHLPAAKAQLKYQHLRKWLNTQGLSEFADDHVIAVWQSLHALHGSERFTTVVKDVFQFQEAIAKAEHADALRFSEDIDALHANEQVFDALEQHCVQHISLDRLCETPKLLSKQQAERLRLLSEFPLLCSRFPLTILRYNVFGSFQAKCIQAQRNKTLNKKTFLLTEENLYADQTQKLIAQIDLNEMTFYAVLHILLTQQAEQAVELIAANPSVINKFLVDSELLKAADGAENCANCNVSNLLLSHSPLLDMCRRAYQQNNRQGFTAQSLLKDKQIYVQSALALLQVSNVLRRLVKKNADVFYANDSLLAKYQADGCIFTGELRKRMLP